MGPSRIIDVSLACFLRACSQPVELPVFRALIVLWLVASVAAGQSSKAEPKATLEALDKRLSALEKTLDFSEQARQRKAEEAAIFSRLADVAVVDMVRYTGPPPRVIRDPKAPGAKNPVIIPAYTFLPRKRTE